MTTSTELDDARQRFVQLLVNLIALRLKLRVIRRQRRAERRARRARARAEKWWFKKLGRRQWTEDN
jgi:hypothetical protein